MNDEVIVPKESYVDEAKRRIAHLSHKLEVTQETRVLHVQQLRDLNKRKIRDITPKKKQLKNNEE